MVQIACVLKSGGDFKPEHVGMLADSIRKYNDHPIICLTDLEINHPEVSAAPLLHDWPGWWSKIELFRVCHGPTLYLDLDTVVVGKLPKIGKRFAMLKDVYRDDVGSGVMSWNKCPAHLYDTFKADPLRYRLAYKTRQNWGDQGFIRDHLQCKPHTFGNAFRSYKAHCKDGIPKGTKVVYFHGKPRPWDVKL